MKKKEKISNAKSLDTSKTLEKAEEKTLGDQQLSQALSEQSSDMIVLINREFKVTYVNPAVDIFLGLKHEEIIGSNMYNYLHPDDFMIVADIFSTFFKDTSPNVQRAEIHIRYSDGTWHTVEATGTNLVQNNVAVAVIVNLRDITERKKAEEALNVSESRYRRLFESAKDGILILDGNTGMIFDANHFLIDLLGYSREQLTGKTVWELGPFKDIIPNRNKFLELQQNEYIRYEDMPLETKDGRLINVEFVSNVYDEDHTKIIQCNIRDITERKLAEECLINSEAQYRLLAEHTKDAVWITDMDLNVTYISPSAVKLLGWTLEEFRHLPLDKRLTSSSLKNALDFYSLEMPKAIAAPPDYVLNRSLELEYFCKNGQTLWIECMFSLIRDENGNPMSILGEGRDITHRRQIEDALRKSEGKYRSILENIQEAYFEVDLVGNFTFFNSSLCRLTGCSREELTGANYTRFSDKETSKNVFLAFNKVYKTGESAEGFDWLIIRNDGTRRYIEASVSLKKDLGGNPSGFKGVIRDVTDRKTAEETTKKSEEKYRSIFANAIEGIYQVTTEGRFMTANNALARMAGYDSPEELMESIKDIRTQLYVNPEDRDRFLKSMHTNGFVKDFEVEWHKKDNTIFWVVLNARAVKDEQGKDLYNEGLVEDISIRKEAEEKLKQSLERLKRAINTTIHVLGSALESRDPYTAGHQSRVADIACTIATEMGLPKDKTEGIRMAGVIHDIGKLSVPTEILTKPTKLTNLEFSLVKEHAQSGYEMLKDVESPWPLADIVHQHHERINGSGYPRKLKGDEILLEARILAVADVVEAMASHRPYRASLGIEPALEEIEKNKGILYDEVVADVCLRLFREKGYQLT